MDNQNKEFLIELFEAAIAAADPIEAMRHQLPEKPKGKTVVVGAGKGAAQMAQALERLWDGPLFGAVVTRYGFGASCQQIEVLEADHPIPDENGIKASQKLIEAVSGLSSDDLVIALICGGGSALLPAPPEGFSLSDEQELNRVLLASGAPISTMNAIRKHFSQIKGGRLAALAYPARVVSLIVSDIPGDEASQVASGPTIPDEASAKAALDILSSLGSKLDERVLDHIVANCAPSRDDVVFANNTVSIIASARQSLVAAKILGEKNGYTSIILSDAIEGETREIAKMHGAIAREIATHNEPIKRPALLLSGGETTVTLSAEGKLSGKGGRNSEFALSLAREISGFSTISVLAADTDGIDGNQDHAGAFVDGQTIERLAKRGKAAEQFLSINDSYSAFQLLEDLYKPGPTGTNVNDFRAIIIK